MKKGAPLFQIDPRPFQAAVEQAKGNVEQAKGNLHVANGNLQVAEARLGKTHWRLYALAKESAISQQELDDAIQADLAAKAEVEANKAAIEAARATIVAANAAVDTAQLNLSFTSIVSPIDGVTAISTAQVGDLVGPQSGPLTSVSTVDPIRVNCTPSEQEYLNSMKHAESAGLSEDGPRKLEFSHSLPMVQYSQKAAFLPSRDYENRRSFFKRINPGNVLRPGFW
jgi:membrane fusion protein (multidrug efflux system)